MDINITLKTKADNNFIHSKIKSNFDLDIHSKLTHEIKIKDCDFSSDYGIGLIVGNSGSGKSSILKEVFNLKEEKGINKNKSIATLIEELGLTYSEMENVLFSVGLSSIPCWVKPIKILSNGEQARASIAFELSKKKEIYIFDEFTSVLNREVGKIISKNLNTFIKKTGKKCIIASCHFDIIDWLKPCWIVDTNKEEFICKRDSKDKKRERLRFTIKEVKSSTWSRFSKFHYLNKNLPGNLKHTFGLFNSEDTQIGIILFHHVYGLLRHDLMHFNRMVIHPDYQGLGLAIPFLNFCCDFIQKKYKYKYTIFGVTRNIKLINAQNKDPSWRLHSKGIRKDYGYVEQLSKFRIHNKCLYTYAFTKINLDSLNKRGVVFDREIA